MASKKKTEAVGQLRLSSLRKGIGPGVTKTFGSACCEAAAVCLEERGHLVGVRLRVDGQFSREFTLHWQASTNTMSRTWNDDQDETEFGAMGIVFLLITRLTGLQVIERSKKGTGFDYWLGKDDELFQNSARLEISGIRTGDDSQIQRRVQQKHRQTAVSDATKLPAFIIVVEFSRPISHVVQK